MLSRKSQTGFMTDGMVAERSYGPVTEQYFVPDHLTALRWTIRSPTPVTAEVLINMRFQRGADEEHGYFADLDGSMLVVSRAIAVEAGAEGVDTGGTPAPLRETLWLACRAGHGTAVLTPTPERWRPMWFSLDAARRRYLRRLAASQLPAVEHAPMWELATEWVYAPCVISFVGGGSLTLGLGSSRDEAVDACNRLADDGRELEREKRERLAQLLEATRFQTGHFPTDLAYTHVLSRTLDCLVVHPQSPDLRGVQDRDTKGALQPAASRPIEAAILAGDAYFQEAWKRDENIALGGLLAAGAYSLARAIVDATWQAQDQTTGRLPLRLRPGEIPGYTSSDGTLWALIRLHEYLLATGDFELLSRKLPMVCRFFQRSLGRTHEGLLPSGGEAVPGHEWETWMDTEFSARSGYPVEIQLLWLACLRRFEPHVRPRNPSLARSMRKAQDNVQASLDLFVRGDYLVDHLDRSLHQVDLHTPNGYFWAQLGLAFDWEWEDRSLAVGLRELGGISGVRTLARSQWETVLGPAIAALARAGRPLPSAGKVNYHRGVEWNWLAQLFVGGHLRHGHPDMAFDHYLARQIYDSTSTAGLGGVSEVFDHRGPAGPDYQAWSMCGLIESIRRFAGISVDVPNRRVIIAPQKPRRWRFIEARAWFGSLPFDVVYRSERGRQDLDITFADSTSPLPSLEIQLPLGRSKAIPSASFTSSEGVEEVSLDPEVRENPRRAILRVPASPTISVTLRS